MPGPADKWQLLKELAIARDAFGVSHRDITVLQALVSFYPGQQLARGPELVVFPSNQSLCARLNGMPCSTMRRHLARLVEAGLIARRDSPNGKRYLRRQGTKHTAFGLDLTPLLNQSEPISLAAASIRAEADHLRDLRECARLMRRDIASLTDLGAAHHPEETLWDDACHLSNESARLLRRKLQQSALQCLVERLQDMLDRLRSRFQAINSAEMSIADTRIEQHQQRTEKDHSLSDIDQATSTIETKRSVDKFNRKDPRTQGRALWRTPRWTITDVLRAYPEISKYSREKIESWDELSIVAEFISPMMGIPANIWLEIRRALGCSLAGTVIAATLERFESIRSPVAYLRSLARRASTGQLRLPVR